MTRKWITPVPVEHSKMKVWASLDLPCESSQQPSKADPTAVVTIRASSIASPQPQMFSRRERFRLRRRSTRGASAQDEAPMGSEWGAVFCPCLWPCVPDGGGVGKGAKRRCTAGKAVCYAVVDGGRRTLHRGCRTWAGAASARDAGLFALDS